MTLQTSHPRAKHRWLVALVSVAMLLGLTAGAALAILKDGSFELDRNATSDPAVAGDDWDKIDDGPTDPSNDDTADASSFVADGRGPTIFTQGGSKDDLNTTGWHHKSGSTPDKDELLDAFAARYGDNLYFGADRFSNSGDAVMGFWFFQQEVTAQAGGLFGPGEHEDGDVLVLSDFTGGGGNVTIRVYQWNGPGGTNPTPATINGTLDLIAGTTASPADCVGPPATANNFPYCATVNTAPTNSPWAFDPKAGADNIFPAGHFFEGGIDLAFLDLGEECFASFLAETRSSTSVDSVLKDFVGGTFERCESTLTTTPSDANGDPADSIQLGDDATDYAFIEGSGGGSNPTGDVSFWICAPDELDDASLTDDPATCDVGGTFVSTNDVTPIAATTNSETTSDPFTVTEVGTWCWRGEYSGDDDYPAASDASTGECFEVTDIASTTTAQKWLPNDTATVVAAGGSTVAGTVVFELFESNNCSGTAVYTSTAIAVNASGVAVSANSTYYTTVKTISWKATFTSTNDVASGDASHCETMTVSVLNNDITVP